MTNREIAELLYYRVCGTPDDVMMVIDQMIEDREITIEHSVRMKWIFSVM